MLNTTEEIVAHYLKLRMTYSAQLHNLKSQDFSESAAQIFTGYLRDEIIKYGTILENLGVDLRQFDEE